MGPEVLKSIENANMVRLWQVKIDSIKQLKLVQFQSWSLDGLLGIVGSGSHAVER